MRKFLFLIALCSVLSNSFGQNFWTSTSAETFQTDAQIQANVALYFELDFDAFKVVEVLLSLLHDTKTRIKYLALEASSLLEYSL